MVCINVSEGVSVLLVLGLEGSMGRLIMFGLGGVVGVLVLGVAFFGVGFG